MFSFTYDPVKHVLVAVATSAAKNDAEFEQLVGALEALDRGGKAANHPAAYVLVVDPACPAPNAKWRQRIADLRGRFASPRMYASIVTESAVARGVITALNWIKPLRPHVQEVTHRTFDEAAAWVETVQGADPAALKRMLRDAHAVQGAPAKTAV